LVKVNATAPKQKKLGVVLAVDENDRKKAIITLGEFFSESKPLETQDEVLEFAKSLPTSMIEDILKESEPTSPLRTFHYKASTRHHYEASPCFYVSHPTRKWPNFQKG
jgi:hypothetical protein